MGGLNMYVPGLKLNPFDVAILESSHVAVRISFKVRHGNAERNDSEKGKSAKAVFHRLTDLEYWLGE